MEEEEEETAKNNRGNFFHLNRICMSLPGLLAKELWPLTRVPTAHPPDTSWGPSDPPLWVTSKSGTYREVVISLTTVFGGHSYCEEAPGTENLEVEVNPPTSPSATQVGE